MTLKAHIGGAGVGKTHSTLEALDESEFEIPLSSGQRVLALTFMHGSRRRLEQRLRGSKSIRGRYDCMVIDRFAWELCSRWRSLLRSLGHDVVREGDFDRTCDTAGMLLERSDVSAWVSRTYPKVILDEAQDLTKPRLKMIRALESSVLLFAAADEFQCLVPDLRPNPAIDWLHEKCKPIELNIQRRTSRPELISAATAIREGKELPVLSELGEKELFANIKKFNLVVGAGKSPFTLASICASNAISWNGGASIAIITPARGDFAQQIVEQVSTKKLGKKNTGPFPIEWEKSDDAATSEALSSLKLPPDGCIEKTIEALSNPDGHSALDLCKKSLLRHQSLTGCVIFSHSLVKDHLAKAFLRHRRFGSQHGPRVRAMTVHSAKNREFDGVIILWPFSAKGSDDQQRRLLYNAITRAQRWVTLIVQSRELLKAPPFTE